MQKSLSLHSRRTALAVERSILVLLNRLSALFPRQLALLPFQTGRSTRTEQMRSTLRSAPCTVRAVKFNPLDRQFGWLFRFFAHGAALWVTARLTLQLAIADLSGLPLLFLTLTVRTMSVHEDYS
jgi:hypothetical protein